MGIMKHMVKRAPKKSPKSAVKKPAATAQVSKMRGRPMLYWVGKQPLGKVSHYPAQLAEVWNGTEPLPVPTWKALAKDWRNLLLHGDNKEILSMLLVEGFRWKVDLIYIDPPFDSGADYVRQVELRGPKGGTALKLEGMGQSLSEQTQYTDIWKNDTYLQFMYERLQLMRELLSDQGSIYLHCDWHKSHQLRFLLDEVFGAENFVNEIVWRKGSFFGPSNNLSQFPNVHDTIFFYTKNKERYFTLPRESYQENTLKQYKYKDEKGTYRLQELRDYTKESIEAFRREGKIKDTPGEPKLKQYLEDKSGKVVETVWSDINRKSDLIYPTEKPEALLERIVKASSNPDSIRSEERRVGKEG